MTLRLLFTIALLLIAATVSAAELTLPADPSPVRDIADCNALHREYRALIDHLANEAERCQVAQDPWVQSRYGKPAGSGECAREATVRCKPWVEQCSTAAAAMDEALARCHAALRAE
ncbi:MAG: hypothetical protein QGF53_03025 [Alphaproteobacteria bacterium]|nr:hypothetical protein [Alphaproteobacteria bacterium]